jgi:hypothetical protein
MRFRRDFRDLHYFPWLQTGRLVILLLHYCIRVILDDLR